MPCCRTFDVGWRRRRLKAGEQLLAALRADLVDLLEVEQRWDAASEDLGTGPAPSDEVTSERTEPVGRDLRYDDEPGVTNVWLLVGVNGVGKTTTVWKARTAGNRGWPLRSPRCRRHLPSGSRRAARDVGRTIRSRT